MKNLTPIISDATQHVSPSTNNMRIEKDEVLVTSLFCRIFDGNGFNTSRCSSSDVFHHQQTTRIGKDEVLVTSLFCRIFDGNGFNTSQQLNVFQFQQTTRIGKDEVLVTSLFCRIFDGNGFNTSRCSSTCFTINKQRESEKMKCW